MSSFIIRNESTAALAAMLDRSANSVRWSGSIRYGIYNGSELYTLLCQEWESATGRRCVDLDAPKIYTVLRRLNERAYGDRYHRLAEEVAAGMPRGEWLNTVDAKPWQMLKTFECYLYQCDEGSVSKSELYQALAVAKNHYLHYLVNKLPDYAEANWS